MAKIDVNEVELVWPGKYNEERTLHAIDDMSEYWLCEGVDQNAGGSHQPGHGKGQIKSVYEEGKERGEEAAVSVIDEVPEKKEACSPPSLASVVLRP